MRPVSVALVTCLVVGSSSSTSAAVRTMLHCGSSIQSDTRGYGGALITTLAPLKLTNYDYLNAENTAQYLTAFSQTKTQASSNFGSTAWQIADGSAKVYAGYDLISMTADYHHWRYYNGNYPADLDKIFSRFRQEYPNAIVFFTGQTPVCGEYGTMAKAKSFNDMARSSCAKNNVPFFDMLAFCEKSGIQPGSDCRHFSSADRTKQGTWLGTQMLAKLGQTAVRVGAADFSLRKASQATLSLTMGHDGHARPRILLNGASHSGGCNAPASIRLVVPVPGVE